MSNAIQFKVNSVARSFDGDPDTPLLWYLRDTLDLTGTKFGCGVWSYVGLARYTRMATLYVLALLL